jgi:hypothetical protein
MNIQIIFPSKELTELRQTLLKSFILNQNLNQVCEIQKMSVIVDFSFLYQLQ